VGITTSTCDELNVVFLERTACLVQTSEPLLYYTAAWCYEQCFINASATLLATYQSAEDHIVGLSCTPPTCDQMCNPSGATPGPTAMCNDNWYPQLAHFCTSVLDAPLITDDFDAKCLDAKNAITITHACIYMDPLAYNCTVSSCLEQTCTNVAALTSLNAALSQTIETATGKTGTCAYSSCNEYCSLNALGTLSPVPPTPPSASPTPASGSTAATTWVVCCVLAATVFNVCT